MDSKGSPRSASPDQHDSIPEDFGDGKVANTADKPVATDAERAISDAEKKDSSPEIEWLSGVKLWLVMMPLCFAFFLVLLDISIIATVSLPNQAHQTPTDADSRL
jgi:hypothetical protein